MRSDLCSPLPAIAGRAHVPLVTGIEVDLGIRGRRALLSGASRGLGRACAFALAQEGVELTIVARRRDALEKTAAEISAATGAKVVPVAGDITSPPGRAAALAACP